MAPVAMEADAANRLRIAVTRLSRLLRPTEASDAAELSPTRVAVLLCVARHGSVRLAQVAEDEGLNPTLLSRTVVRLVDAGLLSRTADPSDRRSAWLALTAAGQALVKRIRRERTAAISTALAGLSVADREALDAAVPALEALAEELGR